MAVIAVESYYSPRVVGRWLLNFRHLVAMAEATGSSARGLMRRGPTPEEPKAGARQKGHAGSSVRYAVIVADLERAKAQALEGLGLEWHVTEALMHGWTLNQFSERSRIDRSDVGEAYQRASAMMAKYLGWSEGADSRT